MSLDNSTENPESNDIIKPETDDGFIEYKRQLLKITTERFPELSRQMCYRLEEGGGECIYRVGINNDGTVHGLCKEDLELSLRNLTLLAEDNKSILNILKTNELNNSTYTADVLIREKDPGFKVDLKIAFVGNVDAGKSTTLGVLTTDKTDDGRGFARKFIMKHEHEIESGRTSDISMHIIGFDNNSEIVNNADQLKNLSWNDIMNKSSKIITLLDLCGHEKYLRTTIAGLGGMYPDYAIILVESTKGVQSMTEEHIRICQSFHIPFLILITKVDMCIDKKELLKDTIKQLKIIAKSITYQNLYHVKTTQDVMFLLENFKPNQKGYVPTLPYILTSNKTGQGIDILKYLLNLLPNTNVYNRDDKPKFSLIKSMMTKGISTIAHGVIDCGTFCVDDEIQIGPDANGKYLTSKIKSIHYKQVPYNKVTAGMDVCFALSKIDRTWLQPGMVILSKNDIPLVIKTFKARVVLIPPIKSWDESSVKLKNIPTIRIGFESVLYMGNIKRTCKIIDIANEDKILKLKERTIITFQVLHRPMYVQLNQRFIITESSTKCVGVIVEINS